MTIQWDITIMFIVAGKSLHILVQEQLQSPLKFGVLVEEVLVVAAVLMEFLEVLVLMHLRQ